MARRFAQKYAAASSGQQHDLLLDRFLPKRLARAPLRLALALEVILDVLLIRLTKLVH